MIKKKGKRQVIFAADKLENHTSGEKRREKKKKRGGRKEAGEEKKKQWLNS